MKSNTHPENYRLVAFKDMSNNDVFITKSTVETKETTKIDGVEYPLFKLEISRTSHPYYTGKSKLVDTAGRVDKFRSKYANFNQPATNDASAEEATAEAPAEEVTAEAPAEEAPAEVPAEEVTAEAPAKEAPAEAPAEEVTAEAPAEEAPVEEAPAEAPAEEATPESSEEESDS